MYMFTRNMSTCICSIIYSPNTMFNIANFDQIYIESNLKGKNIMGNIKNICGISKIPHLLTSIPASQDRVRSSVTPTSCTSTCIVAYKC